MNTPSERSDMPTRILFICMGNICRSPLAECMFRALAEQRDVAHRFHVESAGTTGYHEGERPDPRMRAVAQQRGLIVDGAARQVSPRDWESFDWLICMDEDNRESVLSMGAPAQRVRLLLEADPSSEIVEVPDPYWGGEDGFAAVYTLVESACGALLDELLADEPASRT